MMSTRRRQRRRQRQRSSMAAKSSFNASREDDEISDDDDKNGGAVWTQTTAFELYAREINNETSKVCFARLTSAESGAAVDPSVFLLCVFAASSSTSLSSSSSSENENSETSFSRSRSPVAFTHKRMREMTRISERWNWKILKRVESAEMSLFSLADPPENVPPAMEFGLELKRLRERMERAKRAQMWKLVEDERWWGDSGGGSGEEEEEENRSNSSSSSSSSSSSNIGGGDGEKETDDDAEKMFFDASTRTACENICVYFEYLGFQPTSREWISIQTLLAECLTSEKDRSMIRVKDDDVNDDDGSSSFRLLKRIIDRKTQKPWKDAERRKLNHRYLLARENLLEAKEEWNDAEKSYKEARRKMSKARHEVAKTRKHVRIEFR